MRVRTVAGVWLAGLVTLAVTGNAAGAELCVPTPRLPDGNPIFEFQEQAFRFHDEELVICSPGVDSPVHIAARLWVPKDCPMMGGCAGVVIAHGFGFSKELTFADMYALVQKGLYVLSYDVRGQGASGGQAELLGRNDIADQKAVLEWWHANVQPTKTAFYGISQGGWLSWTAAEFNCGAARAESDDPNVPCDEDGRWIDAIAPMQAPMQSIDDGTCTLFEAQTFVESRANPAIAESFEACLTEGTPGPIQGAFVDVLDPVRLDSIDVPVYAVTSFYDRLVPPRFTTSAYEHLHERAVDPNDVYDEDVRLTISNDGHGDVGGNTAVTGDVFAWIQNQIAGGPPLRGAKVAIAQEWEGNTFRLEAQWPVSTAETRTLYLVRDGAGKLADATGGDPDPDELRNIPVLATPPQAPFGNTIIPRFDDMELPYGRLVYVSQPFTDPFTQIIGEPAATLYVSSANGESNGAGQLNIGLSEITPEGAHEFSHARIGLTGLGPDPAPILVPLSIAGHQIESGNSVMLVITSSDITVALPARGTDPFFVHHAPGAQSSIALPIADLTRVEPSGSVPAGSAYTDDPLGAICTVLNLPCGL